MILTTIRDPVLLLEAAAEFDYNPRIGTLLFMD
jgi:hypothetical protein